jgi:hypothetical protein
MASAGCTQHCQNQLALLLHASSALEKSQLGVVSLQRVSGIQAPEESSD